MDKRAGAAGPDRPCLTVVLCLLAPGAGVRVRGRASTQAAQRQRALLVRDLNTAKEGICRGQQELLGSLVPARGGGTFTIALSEVWEEYLIWSLKPRDQSHIPSLWTSHWLSFELQFPHL